MTNSIGKLNYGAKAINDSTKAINLLSEIELTELILKRSKKSALMSVCKYGRTNIDASELESFLVTELWKEFTRIGPSFYTAKMVNRLLKLRTVDYIRDESRFDDTTSFSLMDQHWTNSSTGEQCVDPFVDTIQDSTDIELSTTLVAFRDSLTDKQRQILDLTYAGYMNKEIAATVGCHINTVTNTMKTIQGLAVSFGL